MDLDTFKNRFLNKIEFDYELAKFTWFGVGGKAEILFIAEDLISLSRTLGRLVRAFYNDRPKYG